MTDITPLLQAVQSFGNWVLFFWLFVRQLDRTTQVEKDHKADLKEFAKGKAKDEQDY